MANQLSLAGAQSQNQSRWSPIYTGRWSSGIWTNRSPLRDANTTRLTEKYYGPSGDALIAGLNVEITNRLTLARRPGNSKFDAINLYTNVDNFDDFRIFGPNTEQIKVMIDQANALYSLYNGTKSLVWTKSTGAGESFMQSVGNSLYFGNGVDNKKWLQSVFTWSAGAQWGTSQTPFLETFFIDPNGNIQQLTGMSANVTGFNITGNVIQISIDTVQAPDLTQQLSIGEEITLSGFGVSTYLNGEKITITDVETNNFSGTFVHANASQIETGLITLVAGGSPQSGTTEPVWSTVVPSAANNFQGGITQDNTVQWTNRGLPVENWGIQPPTTAPIVTVGSSRVAWAPNTYYSYAGVIIDSNGNIQQVTTEGLAGDTEPTWNNVVSGTTSDGTVVWTCIQLAGTLTWQAHHHYAVGTFLIGNASGQNCLFQLAPIGTGGGGTSLSSNVAIALWNAPSGSTGGQFIQSHVSPSPPDGTDTANSLMFNFANDNVRPITKATLNGAGETTATTSVNSPSSNHYNAAFSGTMNFPVARQYTLTVTHQNGFYFGFGPSSGNHPNLISGIKSIPTGQSVTAVHGYNDIFAGNNNRGPDLPVTDSFVINIPVAGDYPYEFDFAQNDSEQQFFVKVNANIVPPQPSESGTNEPIWPSWTLANASFSTITGLATYPNVKESVGQYVWNNLGPTSDYVWAAKNNFTLPNTTIIDSNGATQGPYRSGYTGTTPPTFNAGIGQVTQDNGTLVWICEGTAVAPPPGTQSTFLGGWIYGIALVNTLDDTVSNLGQLTPATGNHVGFNGVTFTPGSGLPPLNAIDPQADYVAIFRSTDGQPTEFLIPGIGNSVYTISLHDYILNGYTDTATDEQLNNLITAAVNGENTPPLPGAVNLTFYLNRIFFSIGNVVYWTSGPDTPVGNGVNGVAPANFDEFPSLVKRIVPTAIGALVFTVSDIFLIVGNGTATNPIQSGQMYAAGIGISTYNALSINGTLIGFFTTDSQFLIMDPSTGASYAAFPIGDQFRLNNGGVGTSWNPANVYVTWHASGEDQAWYICDGITGWYRLMPTPSPETGYTWCPFAQIVGSGVKALKSVEVLPGVHKLLLGPPSTGHILNRNLSTFSDDGESYTAYAVIGSAVLAQPGQLAEVMFITTDCVNIGKPMNLAVIMDEALPYYSGPFEPLKHPVNDPPNLPQSKSILGQRFYMSEGETPAVCRHMQIKVQWLDEAVQNELLTLTIFGSYLQEQ